MLVVDDFPKRTDCIFSCVVKNSLLATVAFYFSVHLVLYSLFQPLQALLTYLPEHISSRFCETSYTICSSLPDLSLFVVYVSVQLLEQMEDLVSTKDSRT